MIKSKEIIIEEIESYIRTYGNVFTKWYVGITSDIDQRLFSDHNVSKDEQYYIWRRAKTSDIAREIEKHFIDVHKTKGGPGGGDNKSDCVYAYKIIESTKKY
ncbi:MAG: hypothetical protein LBF75_08165 [Treponema sp.]|jgi:hypothetical protein|nr:hypothetical protein [Treponema sp.]